MRLLLAFLLGAIPLLSQPNLYQFAVDQDRLSGAADFSFLNHPLTAADRLFVRDGHFYRAGSDLKPNTKDDERVRLFGVNLAFGGNFPSDSEAPRIAKRLRRLGVNLVRCHHMDSSPDSDPENARSILTTGPYPTLNPVSVGRLRRFLDALRAEGIYINLNLHVGYRFRPDVDRVPEIPGMQMPTQSKPLHIFHPRMVELQTEFTRKVIQALKLKDDPVLGMVEIDNETSLLEAYQRGNLQKYALGEYKTELERQQRASGEDDYLLFLAGRDRHYLREMLRAVRETTDRFVPVAGTQMGYGGLLNLDSHADLDYQDNHFYIDHYSFPRQAWDARDWRIRDTSSVGTGMAVFLNMAAARETAKPYTVSEYNQPWPNRQAAEIDPTLAAFGAFQDWDSIMHFAYSHARRWENTVPSGFDINSDQTKYPNIGQSALLFRTIVRAGRTPLRIPVTRELQLRQGREKRVGAIAPFLSAAASYDPAVAFVHPVGLTKSGGSKLPKVEPPYTSDTGELVYDPGRKLYLIQAPAAAGVIGFIGKQKVAAGDMEVELGASARGFATILITSLDAKPLRQSRHLLISTPGYTVGTVPGSNPPRPQKLMPYESMADWWTIEPADSSKPSGSRDGGTGPVWMERVESAIVLRSTAKSMEVYPLDGAGARLRPLPAQRISGGFRMRLQADGQDLAPWFEVVAK